MNDKPAPQCPACECYIRDGLFDHAKECEMSGVEPAQIDERISGHPHDNREL